MVAIYLRQAAPELKVFCMLAHHDGSMFKYLMYFCLKRGEMMFIPTNQHSFGRNTVQKTFFYIEIKGKP